MITYKGRGTRVQFLIVNILVNGVIIGAFLAKSFSADGRMLDSQPTFSDTAYTLGIFAVVLYSYVALMFETARRLKDINVNGWFSLLLFIPGISTLTFWPLLFIPGTKGPNRFGDDPREIAE